MKYLTMVMRSGDPKGSANAMNYTLISDTFSIQTMSGDKLAAAINSGKANVVNMAVSAKGLVSTNGALKNYTTLDPAGNLIGKPRCVILNRIEVNGKLVGYMVFNTNGIVAKISVAEAAALASSEMLANGKIRHTSEGDIVSAIGGTYPLLETNIKEVKEEKPVVDVVFFGQAVASKGKPVEYAGVTVTSKSAKTIADLHKVLMSSNEKLIKTLGEKGVDDKLIAGFKVRQAPGAGFYGVYPMTTVKNLMEKAGGYKCSIKTPMISSMDCEDDCTESIVVYDPKKKTVVRSIEGSEKSAEMLKPFYKKIAEIL